ncbi:hypothetical protein SOPP22_09040 [Shewanella sp. OPT22]|nr:hypothetical protein SOPP22_09040 [Shewanella sp. OPT22]
MYKLKTCFFISICLLSSQVIAKSAPITIYAEPAGSSHPLENITIDDFIEGVPIDSWNYSNKLYHFNSLIGKDITLLFKHDHYKTSQSGTFSISPLGYMGTHHLISWQPISSVLWTALKYSTEVATLSKMKKGYCQVLTTVTAKNKTLDDDPQGESGAKVDLVSQDWSSPNKPYSKIFYFGILAKKSFPVPGLTSTSADGGVLFMNVAPNHKYKIVTTKHVVNFTQPEFICRPQLWDQLGLSETVLINISPPQGPTVID